MQGSSRQGCPRARGVLQTPLERFKRVFKEFRSCHPIPSLPALALDTLGVPNCGQEQLPDTGSGTGLL